MSRSTGIIGRKKLEAGSWKQEAGPLVTLAP